MIRIYVDSTEGVRTDLSSMWEKLTWSGSKQSCARMAEFTLPEAETDGSLPATNIHLSDHAVIYDGETCLLDGFVTQLQKSTDVGLRTIRVYDRGLAMNGNDGVFDFQNASPAEATRRICAAHGIAVGELADTGSFRLTRKFVGVSIYKIIATFYSKASEATGVQYILRFEGENFCVREISAKDEVLVLEGGRNLVRAKVTENSENIVNRVVVLDSSGNQVLTQWDSESENTHGTRQTVLKNAADPASAAKELLDERKEPTRQISVTVLGDTSLIAGTYVTVREPHTGLQDAFAITADSHTWAGGVYSCTLTLDLKNEMVKVDAGEQEA